MPHPACARMRHRRGKSPVHVDHEHAAAALRRAPSRRRRRCAARRYGSDRVGSVRSGERDALQSRSAGVSSTGEPVNVLQVSLPTNFKAARFESAADAACCMRSPPASRRCDTTSTAVGSNCR